MPDDDVIPRRVPRRWRKAARLAAGAGAPDEIAPRVTKALAGTLRDAGGCPGLGELGAAVLRSARGQSDWSDEVARVRAAYETNTHTEIASAVGRALAESRTPELATMEEDEVRLLLATEFLKRLIARNLFGRIRALVIPSRFQSYEGAKRFEFECEAGAQLKNLARRLLAHESGKGLVAPPATSPSEGTEILLHKPIAG